MSRYILAFLMSALLFSLSGCKPAVEKSLLTEISGVWKPHDEKALITINNAEGKLQLLIDDTFIPVIVGTIDAEQETVNLKVTVNGKAGVWTVRRIWEDKEKTTFHLAITLHDGTQSEMSFVRKISTDDLNRIASLEPAPESGPSSLKSAATAQSQPAAPQPPVEKAVETAAGPDDASFLHAYKVSFDCTKASTHAEKTACSNPLLARLDGLLSATYKSRQSPQFGADSELLKQGQREWLEQRSQCQDEACLETHYRERIAALCEMPVVSGAYPESDCNKL